MIYLDNAATAKVLDVAKNAAEKACTEYFLNPSALYSNAEGVRRQIRAARETVAGFLSAEPDEIYFTSGATEANNWAV
ncbi:MAG: aminotransferase class V-fold PLP-dependent enzyme, partial [Firmicutes bacterium]|nr:aminotransferase class V-fold PLP-dependent enzyme [Bacillota bacterium]